MHHSNNKKEVEQMAKKSALGKGLGALIKQSETEIADNRANATDRIDIGLIEVNPFQPRTTFDQEALKELAVSIKQLGIIQPITVREIDGGKYQIISGERRYRASLMAGLTEIPAYIRHADDNNMLELALVENIQREDLDAVEVAISYQRLIDECNLTQESVSDRVGKKRSTVTNYLRLLKLPAEIQLAIRERALSMGHARALVNIDRPESQLQLFRDIIENDMSVRQVEIAVRQINHPEPEPVAKPEPEPAREPEAKVESKTDEPLQMPETTDIADDTIKPEKNRPDKEVLIYEDPHPVGYMPEVEDEQHVKERLSKCFGAKVDLKRDTSGAGKVVISFRTDAELQYILQAAEKIHEANTPV